MAGPSGLQGAGYLASIASVVLMAIPAYRAAEKDPLLQASLFAGIALSIIGMLLRWRVHGMERRERLTREAEDNV